MSALEIERAILSLPQVADVAVVAVPHEVWGEAVGAVIQLKVGSVKETFTLAFLRSELRKQIAPFKLPMLLAVCDAIPRNVMGKVVKKTLVVEAFGPDAEGVQKM